MSSNQDLDVSPTSEKLSDINNNNEDQMRKDAQESLTENDEFQGIKLQTNSSHFANNDDDSGKTEGEATDLHTYENDAQNQKDGFLSATEDSIDKEDTAENKYTYKFSESCLNYNFLGKLKNQEIKDLYSDNARFFFCIEFVDQNNRNIFLRFQTCQRIGGYIVLVICNLVNSQKTSLICIKDDWFASNLTHISENGVNDDTFLIQFSEHVYLISCDVIYDGFRSITVSDSNQNVISPADGYESVLKSPESKMQVSDRSTYLQFIQDTNICETDESPESRFALTKVVKAIIFACPKVQEYVSLNNEKVINEKNHTPERDPQENATGKKKYAKDKLKYHSNALNQITNGRKPSQPSHPVTSNILDSDAKRVLKKPKEVYKINHKPRRYTKKPPKKVTFKPLTTSDENVQTPSTVIQAKNKITGSLIIKNKKEVTPVAMPEPPNNPVNVPKGGRGRKKTPTDNSIIATLPNNVIQPTVTATAFPQVTPLQQQGGNQSGSQIPTSQRTDSEALEKRLEMTLALVSEMQQTINELKSNGVGFNPHHHILAHKSNNKSLAQAAAVPNVDESVFEWEGGEDEIVDDDALLLMNSPLQSTRNSHVILFNQQPKRQRLEPNSNKKGSDGYQILTDQNGLIYRTAGPINARPIGFNTDYVAGRNGGFRSINTSGDDYYRVRPERFSYPPQPMDRQNKSPNIFNYYGSFPHNN